LQNAITDKTRAILYCSPHNPAGVVHTRDDLDVISNIAVQHDLTVIADEIYEAVTWNGRSHIPMFGLPGMESRTIGLMGMTKSYSMGGWRIGYAYAAPNYIAAMTKLQQHLMTCAGSFTQLGAARALAEDVTDAMRPLWTDWEARCRYVTEELNGHPLFSVTMPEGGFYAWVDISKSGLSSQDFSARLVKERQVATVPGGSFGPASDNHVRITCVRSWDEVHEGIARIVPRAHIPADFPAGSANLIGLGVKILIWMGLGIVVGIVFGEDTEVVQPLGDLFIRLLFMAAIPLVFFNLIASVTSLADISTLGRLGLKTLLYYFATTSVALCAGLLIASIMQPGIGMQLNEPVSATFGTVPALSEIVLGLFPSNIFESFSQGNIVQVVVFALFLGVTTLFLPKQEKENIQDVFALLASLFRELVGLILRFAPIGVGALAAATVGTYGGAIFGPLAKFIVSIWSAQMIMVIAYMMVLAVITKRPPLTWLAATCSSLASLVVSMEIARARLRLPENIYNFTLPLGAQLNKDGTAIMLTVVLLFTSQAAGLEFSIAEMATIVFVGLILSESSGGIPEVLLRASTVSWTWVAQLSTVWAT
jgi:Na+/H+-dicarboxylate symporter